MSALTETLTKPVGPLPLGAWVVVVGAGLGIGSYARSRNQNSAVTYTSSPDDGGVTSAGGTNTETAGNLGMTYGSGSYATEPAIETNEDWRKAASRLLTGLGYNSAAVASALTKYLSGLGLTQQEYALVDEALGKAGPTPYAVNAPAVVADPVVANPVPAAPSLPSWANLPKINATDWAMTLPTSSDMFDLGVAGPGGFFSGVNVAGGAPQYALLNGQWVQNFDRNTLPSGTRIATPGQLRDYADTTKITTDWTP